MEIQKSFTESIRLKKKATKIIPSGSSTLANSPDRLFENYSPFYAVSAEGSHFIDVDGNDWIDCEMAMGTVIWGHNRKEINEAIINQVKRGINFSVPSALEYELAQKLIARYNKYESVKFFKNGADAVYASVRVARKITGKEKSLTCSSYHGWLDWSVYGYYHCSPNDIGVLSSIQKYNYFCNSFNEVINTVKNKNKEIACVVICPQNFTKNELSDIINICKETSVVVIFDEITSGMRYAYNGVAGAYDLYPDIICISKGMANGLPLAAALGKHEFIMPMSDLKISNAHAGEAVSIAAAIECENMLSKAETWPTWKMPAERIINNIQEALNGIPDKCGLVLNGAINCFSVNTMNTPFLYDPFREYFVKYFSSKGIFTKGYIIFCDLHTSKEINYIEKCFCECIRNYAVVAESTEQIV